MDTPRAGRAFAFRSAEHLKKNGEIREIFRRGKCFSGGGAKLFVRANGLDLNRVAFTFGRKFGNAVERNRARRLGRESYRLLRNSLETGFDLVLLVYPGRDGLSARMEQLEHLLARASLFRLRPERRGTENASTRKRKTASPVHPGAEQRP